jgi:tRNA (guanine37-N1)-methyltransferase
VSLQHIAVVTLFPEMLRDITQYGVIGRAIKTGIVDLSLHDPRAHAQDKHRTVDDRPYGGGPGMVMQVEPLRAAINEARASCGGEAKVVYLSPQGCKLDQSGVVELAQTDRLILIAGRYEGIDERVIESEVDAEW